VRNSVGQDFNPKDGTLWFTDNQTDGMGDDIRRRTEPRHQGRPVLRYPWKQGKTRITEERLRQGSAANNITDPQVYFDAHAAIWA